MLTEQELDDINWADKRGPERFRAKYPGARAFLTLSRPGFSPHDKHAAIYVAWHADHLVAEAALLILEKKADQWQVIHEVSLWTS